MHERVARRLDIEPVAVAVAGFDAERAFVEPGLPTHGAEPRGQIVHRALGVRAVHPRPAHPPWVPLVVAFDHGIDGALDFVFGKERFGYRSHGSHGRRLVAPRCLARRRCRVRSGTDRRRGFPTSRARRISPRRAWATPCLRAARRATASPSALSWPACGSAVPATPAGTDNCAIQARTSASLRATVPFGPAPIFRGRGKIPHCILQYRVDVVGDVRRSTSGRRIKRSAADGGCMAARCFSASGSSPFAIRAQLCPAASRA